MHLWRFLLFLLYHSRHYSQASVLNNVAPTVCEQCLSYLRRWFPSYSFARLSDWRDKRHLNSLYFSVKLFSSLLLFSSLSQFLLSAFDFSEAPIMIPIFWKHSPLSHQYLFCWSLDPLCSFFYAFFLYFPAPHFLTNLNILPSVHCLLIRLEVDLEKRLQWSPELSFVSSLAANSPSLTCFLICKIRGLNSFYFPLPCYLVILGYSWVQ